jgi:acyl-CoA synthetase (AMP-forming)/AMP-acid ligase II
MLTGELLAASARRYAERPAVVGRGRSLTYARLDALANRCAHALLALGVQRGDRVGLLAPNLWQFPAAYFGIAKAGAISVHLPVRFAKGELEHALARVPLAALIIDGALSMQLEWVRPYLRHDRVLVIDPAPVADAVSFEALLEQASDVAPRVDIDANSAAAILFTSGTTGFPKGALQTHAGRFLSARVALTDFALSERDVLGVASPLYHAAGLYTWFQTGVLAGACAVLFDAWDPARLIDAVDRQRITGFFAVPAQLAMLRRHERFDPARLRSLRVIVYGGAPASPALIDELERSLPHVRFVQNYGQTETGPLFSQSSADRRANAAAIGRPNRTIEIGLFAAPGTPAAPGEVGEIATRGVHVTPGYFGDEPATRELYRGGDDWAWTGDLAIADAAGHLTLVGRSKDTIIAGGINVYPSEIERVARAHPAIADCAAFGLPDATWGELPALAVVVKPGCTLAADEVVALYESDEIGRFKRPRTVFFVDALPYTPAGKLLRGELKKRFPIPSQE